MEFLDAIGSLTVQALHGAAAFAREQQARRDAEAASRRLDLIARAGHALTSTLDYDATLLAMARAAIPTLGDVCIVDVLEEGSIRRQVAGTDLVPPDVVEGLTAYPARPGSAHPIAEAMRGRVTITREVDEAWIAAAAQDATHATVIRRSGLRRFLVVPLVVRDEAIGALSFGTIDPERRYEEADVSLAEVLAQRAAKAIENALLHLRVRQLASSEQARAGELESVITAIGEGIVVVGPDGEVRSANAAAQRTLGTPLPDLAAIGARLGSGAAPLAPPGEPFGPEELELAGRPGTWVEVTAYPTGVGGDGPRGSVMVIRDVTAFRQGQGLREAFMGLLSHELRTPVTSIYAAATVLGQPGRELSEAVRADILDDIVAESDRLYRLVEDLLVLARFDEGLELVREPSLLQRLVPRVLENEQPRWPRTPLMVEVARDLPAVMGDETSIQQVVRNLVSNAAKYAPAGQPVEVVVGASDLDGVTVRVLDRGPGIPDAEAEAIFAPFYRSPATARVAGGAGIGLFVCRRLVEAMSGRIWARPRDGGGSEFGFWLPSYAQGGDDDLDESTVDRHGPALVEPVGLTLGGAGAPQEGR
jgi:two-component system phosphate regulon sensor histidine kinase PhoR